LIAYFDTSAYVAIALDEEAAAAVQAVWDGAETVVVSLLLYPEARSAIARARRNGRPVPFEVDETGIVIEEAMYSAHVVTPTYRLVHEAGELAEARALRGFDAVHLASALQNGPDTVVVTGDKRLAAAARAEGMVVLLAA